MTELLKRAFDEASRLREHEQDALAQWLLAELASEQRWQASFASSQAQLRRLADEALAEHRNGRTQPLGMSSLD